MQYKLLRIIFSIDMGHTSSENKTNIKNRKRHHHIIQCSTQNQNSTN